MIDAERRNEAMPIENFPAYEDLPIVTTLVCRGEPQDDDETHGEGACTFTRDAAGPLLITILTANARKRLAHEKARILAEHYGDSFWVHLGSPQSG
jgi:hypothetical protein